MPDTPETGPHARALASLLKAAEEAAAHFEAIERKALHWMQVFANSELGEARWSQVKNHAGHRGRVLRAAIGEAREATGGK